MTLDIPAAYCRRTSSCHLGRPACASRSQWAQDRASPHLLPGGPILAPRHGPQVQAISVPSDIPGLGPSEVPCGHRRRLSGRSCPSHSLKTGATPPALLAGHRQGVAARPRWPSWQVTSQRHPMVLRLRENEGSFSSLLHLVPKATPDMALCPGDEGGDCAWRGSPDPARGDGCGHPDPRGCAPRSLSTVDVQSAPPNRLGAISRSPVASHLAPTPGWARPLRLNL